MFKQWREPTEYLRLDESHEKDRLSLAPPQAYEIRQLSTMHDLGEIIRVCQKRVEIGMKRWMPIYRTCSDGAILMLPGMFSQNR